MILDQDNEAVQFKTSPAYYHAVQRGRKTAEVQVLNHHEADDLRKLNPGFITLTDLFGENAMSFTLTYMAPVAEILGNELWLFCFKDAR